jgi:hypothetical protein
MSDILNVEEVKVEEVSTEVLYLQDKAQIDIQISSAKAYPRNITRSVENAIAIATMDVKTASTCTYSVPRGGKAISGPSVHLAKIIAQQWKNLRIEARVIDIDAKHVTCQGICWDLENNIAIKTEVKRSIMTKTGRMNDDMITVTGNAGNSIALRNAVFAVIPRGVTDKVYDAALKMITGDVSDETKLIKRRKQVFDALKDAYSVTEKEVLSAVGKASISHITAEDLVVIIGIGQSIKDGDTTVDLAFRREITTVDDKKQTMKAKKAEAEAKEKTEAEAKAKKNEPVEETKSETVQDAEVIPAEEKDFYTQIKECKSLPELMTISKKIPDNDLDLIVAIDDKKRELSKNQQPSELFNAKGDMP